ncbi:MAG: glycosyltransferase, partial [Candidatus Eisenbacteria bacterium]|nr:glycosyltransferase [Candidatus Eisenbacteria bacterium]
MSSQERPIRVLFAGTTFVVGGAERILSHLIRGLAEIHEHSEDSAAIHHRFEVELLALRGPGLIGEEIRSLGIPVHHGLTGEQRLDPGLPLRIRRLLRRGRYDAIYFLDHAHAVFYGVLASLGTTVRVRLMPVHTTGQWNGQPSIKRPIRLVRRSLDRIVAIAEAQRQYLCREEGVPASQLVVIPNGIPLESPDIAEAQWRRAQIRERLGVDETTPVIGITAVLRPEKNHELLLRALAQLRGSDRSDLRATEVWIVGDGVRRPALEAEAASLGIQGAVRFLGHRSDARQIMAGFDVAVLCSHPRVE